MVMGMMERLDLYNIWKSSLVDAMREAGILVRLMGPGVLKGKADGQSPFARRDLSLPSIYNDMISQRVSEAPFLSTGSMRSFRDLSRDKLTCLCVQSILAYQPFPSLFQFLLVI